MPEGYREQALPAPGPEAAAESERLAGVIREEIRERGPMAFDRFMSLALYAPGLGYYSTGRVAFGEGGDFVTAPSLSPLFGRCLARQCEQVLERTGGVILELGAGDASLAIHLLPALAELGALPDRYLIHEPSAGLRERQRQRIETACPGYRDRVVWLDSPPTEPFRGVVLANEVVDALPVRRFEWSRKGVQELRVRESENGFAWTREAAGPALGAAVDGLRREAGTDWPEGYRSEWLPGLDEWLRAATGALSDGAVFVIDYGYPRHEYYHPQRSDGTLICHYRHRAHDDPFRFVGLQDITAFVDFTNLAEAADKCRLGVAGFATQGTFLMSLGMPGMLQEETGDPMAQARRLADAKRLVMPGDMGDRFKVMALTRGDAPERLAGFREMDLREQLLPAR